MPRTPRSPSDDYVPQSVIDRQQEIQIARNRVFREALERAGSGDSQEALARLRSRGLGPPPTDQVEWRANAISYAEMARYAERYTTPAPVWNDQAAEDTLPSPESPYMASGESPPPPHGTRRIRHTPDAILEEEWTGSEWLVLRLVNDPRIYNDPHRDADANPFETIEPDDIPPLRTYNIGATPVDPTYWQHMPITPLTENVSRPRRGSNSRLPQEPGVLQTVRTIISSQKCNLRLSQDGRDGFTLSIASPRETNRVDLIHILNGRRVGVMDGLVFRRVNIGHNRFAHGIQLAERDYPDHGLQTIIKEIKGE